MGGALETGRAHRTRARVKNRRKAESSKAQNRERRSAFQPRSSCGFCVIVSDVAVSEVTLNQRVQGRLCRASTNANPSDLKSAERVEHR